MSDSRSAPRILVVDDEAHIRHVLTMKLAGAGLSVLTSTQGSDALSLAMENRPDLIITDYQMPLMSGLELCQALLEHESTAQIPVLMLTARGFSLPDAELQRTNIVNVLAKPFSPKEILAQVQTILGDRLRHIGAPG